MSMETTHTNREEITHKLIADFSTEIIAASGGSSTIRGVLLTYKNGLLELCEIVLPSIAIIAADEGIFVDGYTVTASNRGTTPGNARTLLIKLTYNDLICTGELLQQANIEQSEGFRIISSCERFGREGGHANLYAELFVNYTSGAKGVIIPDNTRFSTDNGHLSNNRLSTAPLSTAAPRMFIVQGSLNHSGRTWHAEKEIIQTHTF